MSIAVQGDDLLFHTSHTLYNLYNLLLLNTYAVPISASCENMHKCWTIPMHLHAGIIISAIFFILHVIFSPFKSCKSIFQSFLQI